MVQMKKNKEEDTQSKTEEVPNNEEKKTQVKEKRACINGGGDRNLSDTILET